MIPPEFVRQLQEGSAVIAGAPWHFAGAVVLVCTVMGLIMNRVHRFFYRDRLQKATELADLNAKLANAYKEQLKNAVIIPPNQQGGPDS